MFKSIVFQILEYDEAKFFDIILLHNKMICYIQYLKKFERI